jgi:hypothetical protein
MSELEATLTTTHEFSSFVWKQTSGLKVWIYFDCRHCPIQIIFLLPARV